jgi:hypothetical protein
MRRSIAAQASIFPQRCHADHSQHLREALEVSDPTWEVPMSTSVHEWVNPPSPQDLTIGPAEGWIEAAFGLLIAVGLILFVVGAPCLFLAGAIYLNSLVSPEHLPELGQFFGP